MPFDKTQAGIKLGVLGLAGFHWKSGG